MENRMEKITYKDLLAYGRIFGIRIYVTDYGICDGFSTILCDTSLVKKGLYIDKYIHGRRVSLRQVILDIQNEEYNPDDIGIDLIKAFNDEKARFENEEPTKKSVDFIGLNGFILRRWDEKKENLIPSMGRLQFEKLYNSIYKQNKKSIELEEEETIQKIKNLVKKININIKLKNELQRVIATETRKV